jgi:hypothetical protein
MKFRICLFYCYEISYFTLTAILAYSITTNATVGAAMDHRARFQIHPATRRVKESC